MTINIRLCAITDFISLLISDVEIVSVDVKRLSDENDLLRRRLNALERLALENDSLRR